MPLPQGDGVGDDPPVLLRGRGDVPFDCEDDLAGHERLAAPQVHLSGRLPLHPTCAPQTSSSRSPKPGVSATPGYPSRWSASASR